VVALLTLDVPFMTTPFHRLALWLVALGSLNRLALPADHQEASGSDPAAVAATVKEIFRSRCFECHGGSSTQNGVSVLDRETLISKGTVVPGKPDESPLFRAIIDPDEDARMPEGQPPLSSGEIDSVRQWIRASAPPFPADVASPTASGPASTSQAAAGVEYVLQAIYDHQRTLAAEDRRFTRYFSSHHLLVAGATRESLIAQRDAFFKAVNHLSRERRIARPAVVNADVGTIYALDLRHAGWQKQPFTNPASGSKDPANLYDLVLLEYPYAILYEDSSVFDALAREYLGPAGLVRPIPFVRMDWFSSVATLPPLYHDLLELPRTLPELEEQLGIDTGANLKQRLAKRAGMTVSGVSRNNRAVERHPFGHGFYWKSIDYSSSRGSENIFVDPVNLRGAGGEMIFTLPNGLQAYYVCDGKGTRISEAPTSIVTDKFAEDRTVRNGLSCIRCHDRGMKDFRDDVRPAVEGIAGSGPIEKSEVLAQYPPQAEMERLLAEDRERFLSAMTDVLGAPQTIEPMTAVTQRFLDAPLGAFAVAGELGLGADNELKATFRLPGFAALGLVALGNSGVIRRDMWEDYFDQVVRHLGLGIPVVPIDGVSRPDYLPPSSAVRLKVSTDRPNNVFAPGDDLVIFIENQGKGDLFVEVIGTGTRGERVVLVPAGEKVAAGSTFRFPKQGAIKVQASLGKEHITVYASETPFEAGRILRARGIDDRVVHRLYELDGEDGRTRVRFDAKALVKRTIDLETR
jgi:mono/diheme cytochrome c family protein